MLPGLGPVHLLMVLVVALIVLGPTKLPEFARHVGSALQTYRDVRDRLQAELHPRALVETVLARPDEEAGPHELGREEPGAAES